MKIRILVCFLFLSVYVLLSAGRPLDNVVINTASDDFSFVETSGGFQVRHVRKAEYLATRHSENVRPHVFYNHVIRLDKVSGGKAEYRNVNSPTVFHDDSKVCWFNLRLGAAGKKGKAEFRRTYTDPAHFTGVYLQDDYPVRCRTFTFRIPASLPGISLTEDNFPAGGVSREERVEPDGARLIIFTAEGLPEFPDDPKSPSALSSLPHIGVRGFFPDTDSLYRYQSNINRVDTVFDGAAELVSAISAGAGSRAELIEKIYGYVRSTIRYVAYEEGEAAFRPDTPSETFRKRYGDCKSMSLLLATLLNRAGVEACIAAVGTRAIPFLISGNPSLAAADHMICIVPLQGDTLFLDPTQEYVSSRHVPAWIRGKDAMMFVPGGYRMVMIPAVSPEVSEDMAEYRYRLTDNGLEGRVLRVLREDMAGLLSAEISDIPGQRRRDYMAKMLVPSTRAAIPVDSVSFDDSVAGLVALEAPIVNSAAVTAAEGCVYLDLNTSGEPFTDKVDTVGRQSDYELPFPARVVRRCIVTVPRGREIVLPCDYVASTPNADFSCRFSRKGNTVEMVKTMNLKATRVPLPEIPAWNKAVSDWNSACNLQIEIK